VAAPCGGFPAVRSGPDSGADETATCPRARAARRLGPPRLLDLYVARQYLAVFGVAFGGLVGIFYISTFIDLADKLFGGMTTTAGTAAVFLLPDAAVRVLHHPAVALVASLVTVGVLTKNSELIVMRACGISLYRSSAPLLIFAVLLSALLFELQERVLADSNREARRLNAIIRGYPPATYGVLNRRWLVGASGDIYHYQFYDPRANHFTRLSMFHVDTASWKLGELTFAKEVMLAGEPGAEGQPAMTWVAHEGWRRAFTTAGRRTRSAGRGAVRRRSSNARCRSNRPLISGRPEDPDADRMTFGELKQYITQLETSGYHAVPYMVQLQRKVAFPFRDADHDAARSALCGDYRQARRHVRHRHRHRLRHRLLDGAEHLRSAGCGRLDFADAGRLGTEHHVWRGGPAIWC
jgi:lipopolysaccharide export LptBFGC system permease protein LptF